MNGYNVAVPAGLTQYQEAIAYQNDDGSALNVIVTADFNVQRGQLTVTYISLDPATGQAPAGVFDGFLPPNNSSNVGEGYVQYTVQPRASLPTGAMITQSASVLFDTSATLDTTAVVNTIDVGTPTSTVAALPATVGANFPVSWAGSDDAGGSGIASYDVYVSDNGGPFVPWLTGTAQTSATYHGAYGHKYAFYSIATDNVGNVETVPAQPQATTQTVLSPLEVTGVSPSAISTLHYLQSLPNNQIVISFNRAIAGLTADKSDGSGFAGDVFAVMLIPSGPDGGALAAQGKVLWTAPSGVDSGDLPIPATAVYHVNPVDGTSTITLTLSQFLPSDVYLLTVNPLSDIYGDPLGGPGVNPSGIVFMTFDYRPDAANGSPLKITDVTTRNGSVPINGNVIAQPDTIGVQFNKPLNSWTVNSSTVHLLANPAPGQYHLVSAPVFYSPSTQTAYLTPGETLSPGVNYVIAVDPTVSDDQKFPSTGVTLGQPFYATFAVNGLGVTNHSPLTVTGTTPADKSPWTVPLGYATVHFSEAIDLQSLSRFSAMLITKTGGLTTGNSGYADVPVNAKLAFNPNTNDLIIVPTGLLPNRIIDLFSMQGITAQNKTDVLQGTPVYATFLLNYASTAASVRQASVSANDFVATVTVRNVFPATVPPPGHSALRPVFFPRTIHPVRPVQAKVLTLKGQMEVNRASRWPLGPRVFIR